MIVEGGQPNSTPGGVPGFGRTQSRGRGRASELDPRPGRPSLLPQGQGSADAAFQEQLHKLQLEQQERVLQEQKDLEAHQHEVWKQQKDALE